MKRLKRYWVEIVFSVLFLVYTGTLNTHFLEGSNINYTISGHDEYLTMREVYSMLEPADFKHFAMSVASGDVMFYGRVMFYTDALVAFVPYKIFGISGLVYTLRMTHVLYLLFAMLLLSRTFLKTAAGRAVFYLAVLTLYYTSYFAMIPKPDPMQLLVLAVFLYYGAKRNWEYGRYFIWLGLAYGIKFNVLFVLPLFFLLPFFIKKFNFKRAFFSGVWFLVGLVIAVPALLLSAVKPVFFKSYIGQTFLFADQYDDTGVSIIEWLRDGLFDKYLGGTAIGTILFMAFLFFLFKGVLLYFKSKQVTNELVISLVGFCLLIPVILLTQRLWPHYLWIGFVFLVLGVLAYAESTILTGPWKKAAMPSLAGLFIITSFFGVVRVLPLMDLEKEAAKVKADSEAAYAYLKKKSPEIAVIQDITVYYPFADFLPCFRYHPFAGPYPYEVPKQRFSWTPFLNKESLDKMKPDYMITNKENFEIVRTSFAVRRDEIKAKGDAQLREQLNKTIFPDTVFGEIRVYRIAK